MSSSLLGVPFEPLPTLQEDDELVALSTILNLRRGSLREPEIWAVCRECCLALRSVSKSSVDLFQRLCLTPDTLTFNAAGSVSFSDSDVVDKDYQPPEFYQDGNTFKGHIFSLARTLLEASAHDLPEGFSLEIGTTLLGLLTRMSLDDPKRRPTLEEVTVTCNRGLGSDPGSSKAICRTLSAIGRRRLSLETQYEYPGVRRKSSSSSQSEAPKATTDDIKNGNVNVQNGNANAPNENKHESLSRTNSVDESSMHATASHRKPAGLRLQTSASETELKTHKEQLREPPSPAALNNLSQRAQDILKKLYASDETKTDNNDNVDTGSSGGLVVEPSVKENKSCASRSPARSPHLKRKEHHGGKNKNIPDAEEITSKLKELALSRERSGDDKQQTPARMSPEVTQLRKILQRIPSSENIRTGSPGRRRSPSTGPSPSRGRSPSQSSSHVSSPRQRGQSPKGKDSPRRTPQRHESLRRKLSSRQLNLFIKRRKSSGSTTPEIMEELEKETVDDLDLILNDPFSDDDEQVQVQDYVPLIRSQSDSGGSSSIGSFQLSVGSSVRRTASMKQTLMTTKGLASGPSLENISEDRPLEDDVSECSTSPKVGNQRRSSITAETGQLDNMPSYSNIKELTQVQNQFLNSRRSSISDFRVPSGYGSRATHFTPIVVTDKPVLKKAASSPTMDSAKAKARAALKAKLDMSKKMNRPPPELLQDLENDVLENAPATPRFLEENLLAAPVQPKGRRHSSADAPMLKRKQSNDSIISCPSDSRRKMSTSSSSETSRKVSTESMPGDLSSFSRCRKSSVSSDKVSLKAAASMGSVYAEVGSLAGSTELLASEGNVSGSEQRSNASSVDLLLNMDSLHPKVRTVAGSPITSKNSFSPIELPQEVTAEPQLTLKPEQSSQEKMPQVKGQISTSDHVKGQPFLEPVVTKTNEQTLRADNVTNQTGAVASSEKQTNMETLSSTDAIQSTKQMRVSPSICVNDQTVLASSVSPVPQNVQPPVAQMSPIQYGQLFTPMSPVPVAPIPVMASPQVTAGQIPAPNMPIIGHISPAPFMGNQPNMLPTGHVMPQGVVPGSSSPVMVSQINAPIMPGFSYQVQLQQDPQTGLYRMVPVGIQVQVPFHGSSGSLSGNSFGSPGSNSGTPPQGQNVSTPEANMHSYWHRHKNVLDTSSDGDSTCIPMSPEAVRKAVVDRKKDQVKKRLEKGRHGTPPSKRSNAKTASSSLIRNPTDSESSESYAFARPKERSKPSPQIARKKHVKGSQSDGDRKDRIREKVKERNELKVKRVDDRISRSVSCEQLNTSIKSQDENTELKQTKTKFASEDADDSRPLDIPLATASPASVSSVSHDSGVNMRFNGVSSGEDMFTATQLADALQGHSVMRRVMKLIRHTFAFDGYMDNGVEDKEMAEYITSLAKLSWTTFSSAVTEKFCDLYWEEELLEKLYEAINGEKPKKPEQPAQQEAQHRPTNHPRRSKPHSKPSKSQSATKTKSQQQKQKTTPPANSKHPEEDDILSDLLPEETFTSSTSSTPSRHSRSAVKSIGRSESRLFSNDKKLTPASKSRGRSHSSDKARSASRDRTKTKMNVTQKEDTRVDDKTDGESSDGKRMAPPKPKRYPSPGMEPVPKPRTKKQEVKGHEPRAGSKLDGKGVERKPSSKTRSRSVDSVRLESRQARISREEKTNKQTDSEELFTGLPAENQPTPKSHQVAKSKSRELPSSNMRKSHSNNSLASSLSDSHYNSMNKSRDSADMNQSLLSMTSSQLSEHTIPSLNLDESTSSFENPVATSMSSGSNSFRTSNTPSNKVVKNSTNDNAAPALPARNSQFLNKSLTPSSQQIRPHSDSSDSNSPAVKERISTLLQNALQRTDSIISTSSNSSTSTSHFLKTSGDDSTLSLSGSFGNTDDNRPGFPNGMVCRTDTGVDPRIAAYTQQLTGAGETQNSIESKIADVEQQLMMERRMRNKTEKYHQKLHNTHTKTTEHKTMLAKVTKQLKEMATKIEFLESAKRHLEMLYAEQWGLDFNLLYSFATSMGTEPLQLKTCEDNQLLSFHIGRNKTSLQAGEPLGLFSFLFARQALLDGYLHHFFYTYHYFATSEDLLQFIMDKFQAATSMYETSQQENRSKILCRAVDILQVWVEGFYEVDYRHNTKLLEQLIIFTTEKIIPVDPQGQSLLQLLDKYQREKASISSAGWPTIRRKVSSASPQASPVRESTLSPTGPRSHHDASPRTLKMGIMACFTKKDSSKQRSDPMYLPVSSMNKDGFSLSEHTSFTLAQQLTLMQQDLFQSIHPVHYLNSRCKGIGVSTNNNSATSTQSTVAALRHSVAENGDVGTSDVSKSLFVGSLDDDGMIRMLLDHARDVSHWVSAEVVTCSSTKTQMTLLSKFINTAKTCYDMRNFATCVQIMDGLDNLIVRQVPAWRTLPSKVASVYEELCTARVTLQGDSDSLMVKGDSHRKQPTLPPTLLFIMHVQQLEIGGFQLVNGLYKWTKIKSIAKLIDLIRLFQDKIYDFEPDIKFQELLKQRVDEFHHDDIQVLAAQNSSNFHQFSLNKGGRRLQNAFQRVKANLQH